MKKVDIYRNLRYNVFVSCYERKPLLPRILFLTDIWGLTMKNRQAKSLFRNERSRCLRARQGCPRSMPIGFVINLEFTPPLYKFSYSLIILRIAGFKICDISRPHVLRLARSVSLWAFVVASERTSVPRSYRA